MHIPDSEPWLKRARRHMKARGHGDQWLSALKNRFENGPDNATNAEVAEEITAYLSDEKADTGAETIEKALEAQSDNGTDSAETDADSDELSKAFDPFAERESNTLELKFE